MVERKKYLEEIRRCFRRSNAVCLLGPRQCGKTTIARMLGWKGDKHYFDLEDPMHFTRLSEPMITLESLKGLVVIDEIQRKPELFEILRVLLDRVDSRTRFLLLGSASSRLVKGISESLAGRVAFVDMSGFNIAEVGIINYRQLWLRGGFPLSYLAENESDSLDWRNDFIRTFLERDIPQMGITVPAETLRRFWVMTAHYNGNVWNAAEFARSLGCAEATARHYLDIMSGSFMLRQLQPWFENIKKRQVKSPKIYVRDSGILHALFSIKEEEDLLQYPKLGASWEGFVVEHISLFSGSRDLYFWATHAGCELDMLMFTKGKRIGFEIKFSDAPRITKSMRIAFSDLALEHLYIIYPGCETYQLDYNITVLSVNDLISLFQ